jgi:hypothetical protein
VEGTSCHSCLTQKDSSRKTTQSHHQASSGFQQC